VNSSSLQKKHRSGPFARYAGFSPSWVATSTTGAPMNAATEHRVLRPLAAAGLDKAMVRRIAHELALPCADKPAAPCLASRIPHHEEVSPAKLAQVEAAEKALRALGFADSRVRHHGDVARIELLAADLPLAVSPGLREAVQRAATDAGFRFAAIDLAGIQSGAFTLALVDVTGTATGSGGGAARA